MVSGSKKPRAAINHKVKGAAGASVRTNGAGVQTGRKLRNGGYRITQRLYFEACPSAIVDIACSSGYVDVTLDFGVKRGTAVVNWKMEMSDKDSNYRRRGTVFGGAAGF